MKKLLVSLLISIMAMSLAACGSGGEEAGDNGEGTAVEAATIKVQVEETWLPYYEQVKETVLEDFEGSEIEFIVTGSFDHMDVLDSTDPTNEDVADVFAFPADRLYGFINNESLAALPAEEMAADVGGFADFNAGIGGSLKVDGEYFGFPYNIETLIGFVNVENAATLGLDITQNLELTELGYEDLLVLAHDCWFGVGFANAVDFELLEQLEDGTLSSDATSEFADLTADQQAMFTALFEYWKQHHENGTDLWDKDAAGGYLDTAFSTGGGNAVRIDGPWASGNLTEKAGSLDNLEIIPLSQITVGGQPLTHWKGGWVLGANVRIEEDESKMALAEAFIEEMVNPDNAAALFEHTGKILENVDPSQYEEIDGIDEMNKAVIAATYESYESSVSRPLFTEWGQVWGSWQNALLSWSSTVPTTVEEAYEQVKASFESMLQNF